MTCIYIWLYKIKSNPHWAHFSLKTHVISKALLVWSLTLRHDYKLKANFVSSVFFSFNSSAFCICQTNKLWGSAQVERVFFCKWILASISGWNVAVKVVRKITEGAIFQRVSVNIERTCAGETTSAIGLSMTNLSPLCSHNEIHITVAKIHFTSRSGCQLRSESQTCADNPAMSTQLVMHVYEY